MKIKIIDDNGIETIIENVLVYDCFTKTDVENIIEKSENIDNLCKKIIKKCSELDYYPSNEEFSDIVRNTLCNY